MAEFDNPRPSSQPVGSTDQEVLKDNLIVFDNVVNSSNNSITTRKGQEFDTLTGYQKKANEAIQAAGGTPLNNGIWAAGQTFTAYNQYMIYLGVSYKPKKETTLPYGPTGATPDLAFVQPFGGEGITPDVASKGEKQQINISVYPIEFDKSASTSAPYNNAPAGTEALRDAVGDKIYYTSEIVSGSITSLDFSGGTATVGGAVVTLKARSEIDNANIGEAISGVTNYTAVSIADMIAGKTGGSGIVPHEVGQVWRTNINNTTTNKGGATYIIALGAGDGYVNHSITGGLVAIYQGDSISPYQSGAVMDGDTGTPTDHKDMWQAVLDADLFITDWTGHIYSSSTVTTSKRIRCEAKSPFAVLRSNQAYWVSTDPSGSRLSGFKLKRHDTPKTIVRDWSVYPPTYTYHTDGQGYMPGVNDNDGAWAGLTPAEQAEVGCYIDLQHPADGTVGGDIEVTKMWSDFGSVIVQNAACKIWDNKDMLGERASAGVIWVRCDPAVSAGADHVKDVFIWGNETKGSGFNGIYVSGTDAAWIYNNKNEHTSETGLKLDQDGASPAPLARGNINTVCFNNESNYNFEDGFNFTSRFPNADTDETNYVLTNNFGKYHGSSGATIDGKGNRIESLDFEFSGADGITSNASNSEFWNNKCKDANRSNTPSGRYEFVSNGFNNDFFGNKTERTIAGLANPGAFIGNANTCRSFNFSVAGQGSAITINSGPLVESVGNSGVGDSSRIYDAVGVDGAAMILSGGSTNNRTSMKGRNRKSMTNDVGGVHFNVLTSTPGSESGNVTLSSTNTGVERDQWVVQFQGSFEPASDALNDLGRSAALRVRDLYIQNAPTVGSDYRIKKDVSSIPQEFLDFSMTVEIKEYRLKDGQSSRKHFGIVITEDFLKSVNEIYGVDDCAALCHSVFVDEHGKPFIKMYGDTEIGEMWQVRYDEWQNILLEAMRRKVNAM